MTNSQITGDRRPQRVALLGFLLQLVAFGMLVGVAIVSQSDAIAALARFVLVGIPIWFVLYLIFNQVRRVNVEMLETAELQRTQTPGATTALFELDAEGLLIEQYRLKWLVRWLLPSTTILAAVILLGGHFLGWRWTIENAFSTDGVHRTQQPTLMMWFVVGVGFLSFLYARYALALARLPQWQLLRGGATYMAGNAVGSLLLAIALMAGTTLTWAEPLFAYIIRTLLIILGIEFVLNFVFDLYRPRTRGDLPRPAFESRLLGMIGEPGGLAKSIADAINYQFGFEVSSTWFYQLLKRWMLPMTIFTILAIVALTSIVIVDAEEEAVVERFGRLAEGPSTILRPGIHFKWPYPVEVVKRAPVKRISEIVVGEAAEKDDEDPRKAIVWTEAHDFVPELMLLVASTRAHSLRTTEEPKNTHSRSGSTPTESVPVSLLMASMPIEYRIHDLTKYLYTHKDPRVLIESVAYQILSNYAANVNFDELMGPGRDAFNKQLKLLLQRRLDELNVGVEVVFVGLRGAHPSAKDGLAAAFHDVIKAKTGMAASINAAHGESRKMLTRIAGTESRARELDQAILHRDRLKSETSPDPKLLAEADQQVKDLIFGNPEKGLAPLSGEAVARIADARADASRRISDVAGTAKAFGTQVAAYQAAPELFRQRKRLEVYEGLEGVRKFLIVGDPKSVVIEYETSQQGALDQVLEESVKETKKNGS